MKKMGIIMLTAVLSLGICGKVYAQNKNNEVEVTFTVNLHCEQCKKKVMNSLPHEKGVKDMKADVAKQEVWIKFDSKKTDKEKLQKAIEKLGFTATEVILEAKAQGHAGCAATCKKAHSDGCSKTEATKKSKN
ncbi:MAG: cation transporter [Bacteroidales bacterium]|nr:cation transporter [Bacteroidales bacterium]MCL2133223.1 cation transporter [Bacteroidales bacterium]